MMIQGGKIMSSSEVRAYRNQLKIVELTFKKEVNTIIEKVHKLSIKNPGKIFSVNDIQNLT